MLPDRWSRSSVETTPTLTTFCQIVFLKMALSLSRIRSIYAFEPWLFTIARNVCRDHLRRIRLRKMFVPLSIDHEMIPTDQRSEDPQGRLGAPSMVRSRSYQALNAK